MNKKKILLTALVLGCALPTFSQTNLNVGGGYFGETVTYPGIVAEFEYEKLYTEKFATPFRINLGFYAHERSHTALFLDFNEGFRRYFKDRRWYLEQHIGAGVMLSFYDEDVWHVDDEGNVARVSNFANFDFMPSIAFGAGYNLTPKREKENYIWIRPKLFWQLPFNNLATVHTALQVGYTYNLITK